MSSPEEAAFLLGVHPAASVDDIQRMYQLCVQTHDPDDHAGIAALTQAREVLLRSRGRVPAPSAASAQGMRPPVATPPRRGLPAGAVVGIVLGGVAVLGVLVVAITAIAGFAAGGLSGALAPQHSASTDAGSAGDVLDGVTVRYSGEGWTFFLDSPQDCPAAKIVVGFSDTPGGESEDLLTDTAPLEAGVTYTYAPIDTASTHPYAHIDEIVCHAM
ncbi:hypothetical protein ACFVU2_02740 [Leifsonia sp. NPDC058194]|uniref:hypothetical protein n=1 Tax=Leifsonia sp. NPDC058194 TaxID=3346374 RepID=UPI0036D804D6